MSPTHHCQQAADSVLQLNPADRDYQRIATLLVLIGNAISEDGLDQQEAQTFERVIKAMEPPGDQTPYCHGLHPKDACYRLQERFSDLLLGERLPIHIFAMDGQLIVPAMERIHKGMLASLASHWLNDGEVCMDPSPIRNRLMDTYNQTTK